MSLNELAHYIGGDIAPSGSGDLQTVNGVSRGQQRILRRLLTNPGDYIFHLDYGAGLPQYIGQLIDIPKLTALIKGQILLEPSVARTPVPIVTVTAINGGVSGAFSVNVLYTDASTSESTSLNFDVSN